MSARGVITEFFDLPSLEKQKAEASALVQQYIDSIKGIPSIRAQAGDTSNLKESVVGINALSAANVKAAESTAKVNNLLIQTQIQAEKLSQANAQAKQAEAKAGEQLSKQQLAEIKLREANAKAAEKEKAATSKTGPNGQITEDQAALKVATQQSNKEIIDQAKAMLAASNAAKTGGETVELLRSKLAALTKDRDTKINILDPAALDKATQQIAVVKKQLDSIEQAGGNFKGNVGNYTDSINILKGSLDKATASMQKTTEAGTQNDAKGQALAHEIGLLTSLVGQQANGFTSLTREVSNTAKAVETIHEQLQVLKADGLQDTEAFQQLEETFLKLNQQFTDGKRKLNEFRLEQKILTDQTPKIAALTAAARGLGGIYATAAGGAQLLAPENEHLAEKLNQLVAVMTLLQGLEEVHRLLTEKNAIATALFGTTTAVTTVALEGEKAATEAAAVTGGTFNKVLSFIASNPIALFITGLAAVVIYLASTFESEEEQLKKTAKASEDYSDALKNETATIEQQNKLLNERLVLQKKDYENTLALKTAQGTDAATQLALKIKIAETDQKITQQQLDSHPDIIKDIQSQKDELGKLLKLQTDQETQTKRFADFQKKGVDNIVRAMTEQEKLANKEVNEKQGTSQQFISEGNTKALLQESKDREEINKKAIDAAQSALDELQKIKEAKDSADEKSAEAAAEAAKLSAEEQRKLALATAQIEVSAVHDKNAIILGDERSSLSERLGAMESNFAAERQLAKAELANVLNDNTKSVNDRVIAESQYTAKVKKINADGVEAIRKETLADHNRRLVAEQDFNKSIIQADADKNDTIAKDDTKSIDDRTAAYGKYVEDQKKLVLDDAEFQKATKVLTAEEITALDEATAEKLKQIAVKSGKDLSDILSSSLKEQESLRESFDNLTLAKRESANLEGKTGNARKKAIEENSKLEYEAQRDRLQGELDTDQQIRDNILSSTEAREKASKDYNNKQAELYKLDVDRANKAEQDKLNAKKKIQDLEVQIASETIDIIQALGDRAYQKKVDQIQAQIDLIEQQKAKDIEVADQTITNAQDRADAIAVINAKAQSEEELLNQKKRQQQEKQARFDKAAGIAKIILSTAVAEIEALAYLSNPVTAPLYPAIATLIGILGAAQLAVAIATPIPKFKHGGVAPGGIVEVGDGGRSEAVRLPDGTILKTPARSTFVDLPAGSVIHPDFDKMMLSASLTGIPEFKQSTSSEHMAHAVGKMERSIVKAITDKQENHWHMPGRYDMAMRDGSRFKAYLKSDL